MSRGVLSSSLVLLFAGAAAHPTTEVESGTRPPSPPAADGGWTSPGRASIELTCRREDGTPCEGVAELALDSGTVQPDREAAVRGGIARFTDLIPAEFRLRIRDGTRIAARLVSLRPGEQAAVAMQLEPPAVLDIEVVDDLGAPVPGATVSLAQREEGGRTAARVFRTDPHGRATVDVLPSRVEARATAAGHWVVTQWTSRTLTPAERVTLRLVSPRAALVTGTLAPGALPNGVNLYALPVNVPRLPLTHLHSSEGSVEAQVEPDGRFQLDGLVPGVYELVTAPGQRTFRPRYVAAPSDAGAVEIVDPPPPVLTSRVRGRVTDALGSPMADARVEVRHLGERLPVEGQTSTDDDGRFDLRTAPGDHVLRASDQGEQGHVLRAPWAVEKRVMLREGGESTVDLVLPSLEIVSGEVRDPTGRPLAGIFVKMDRSPARFRSEYEASSDTAGRFRIPHVKPGRYVISAGPGKLGGGGVGQSLPQEIAAGQSAVRLVLLPLPRIRGRVVDSAGRPVPAFEVARTQVEDVDGRFDLAVEGSPGRTVGLVVPGMGYRAFPLVAPPGAVQDLGTVMVHPGVTVRGAVLDASTGRPVPDASVSAPIDSWGVIFLGIPAQAARTDEDGRFEIRDLAPDTELEVTREGYASLGVRVPEAGVVRLSPSRMIRGTLRDARGRGVCCVRIDARGAGTQEQYDVTGLDGSFLLGFESAGSVRLTAEGTSLTPRPVPVRDGQETRVELRLPVPAR